MSSSFLIIVDFITGWIKAIATKELSSRIGMLGIAKKVTMLFVVAVAVRVEKVVGNNLPNSGNGSDFLHCERRTFFF